MLQLNRNKTAQRVFECSKFYRVDDQLICRRAYFDEYK